jgi:asparagine synthase (glutamine-hydrolysing)
MSGAAAPESRAGAAAELARHGALQVAVLRHRKTAETAEDLLRAYRRGGAQAVHERCADCTVVVSDEATGRLVLARDFVGATPLYWAERSGAFAFGTRISDVLDALALEPRPDRAALAALLLDHAGAPLDRTYFQGVRAVPPACTLVLSQAGTQLLAAAQTHVSRTVDSYADAVERFRTHLREAVINRLDSRPPTAVLVSGGLDSAALLCLAAQHGEVLGITYGPQDDPASDESRYIDVLRAAGIPIERTAFHPTIDAAALEQSIRQTEMPVGDIVPLTAQRAKAAAHMRGARTLLIGTWGDQVLAPFPPPQLATLSAWRAAALAARYQSYLADVPVADVRRALVRQSLRRRAPAWLLRARRTRQRRATMFDVLAHEFAAGPVMVPASYAAAVRANTSDAGQVHAIEGTTKWAWPEQLDARLPFLDRELLQFLMSLPDDVAYHQHRLKPLLRDALRGVVPDAILERRDKGDYTSAIRRGQLPLAVTLELLDGLRRPLEFGLMSRRSAAKTLARLRTGYNIAQHEDDAMMLLSLDIWLRICFQSTP